jgi:hypothetical protein
VRWAKAAATTLVLGAALFGFWRFFLAELGGGEAPAARPPAVIFSAPPGYDTVTAGDLTREAAAARLAALVAERPSADRLALHFTAAGAEIYWLVDRRDPAAPLLIERAAGASGTRLETTWTGGLEPRLAWAARHGGFDVPGRAPGTSRNLYH